LGSRSTINAERSGYKDLRPASESEQLLLIQALEKDGLCWNADLKRIEKIRWRATSDTHRIYYYLDAELVIQQGIDWMSRSDNERFEIGNYFQTKSDAQGAANDIRSILKSRTR
jgi:hypothetical protein